MQPSSRLDVATLPAANDGLCVPTYPLDAIGIGIVHLGPGAFHRAHQAEFVDRLLAGDPQWGICAVSLRTSGLRDALQPQQGLYTVAILDEQVSYRVVGALREVLVAPEDCERVLQRMAAAQTRIVTLTVTEKGYCLDTHGELDRSHPDIVHDIASPQAPVSAIGYLVEALRRRHAAGHAPFTTISCDNLVDNGMRLRDAVVRLAEAQHDTPLAEWVSKNAAFPRTMVDSIVPATDDALRHRTASVLGVQDAWPVQRESFTQWVIEDRFCNDRPDFASVGVTLTNDVPAYVRAKLRLLNGAHSSLAYLGLLMGHQSVGEAMADTDLAAFLRWLMIEDIRPTLTAPPGLDLAAYIDEILQRFRNPTIRHELAQIAWDGSQKLPFRLFGTILDHLAGGHPIERLCLPVAAWMHFVRRRAQAGEKLVDPLAEQLLAIGRQCVNDVAHDLPLFLALDSVFPRQLGNDSRFIDALAQAYDCLRVKPELIGRVLRETHVSVR